MAGIINRFNKWVYDSRKQWTELFTGSIDGHALVQALHAIGKLFGYIGIGAGECEPGYQRQQHQQFTNHLRGVNAWVTERFHAFGRQQQLHL
jgi:hypothetical protein